MFGRYLGVDQGPGYPKGNHQFRFFDFEKSDLLSDESLWALYEKWRIYHEPDVTRTHQEMQERFHYFKKKAKMVYEHNTNTKGAQLGLNVFGDGELPTCCGRVRPDNRRTRIFFDFNKEDLESDETLWALYAKWCSHEDINRTPEEMKERFCIFKDNAECLYEHNMICSSSRLDLGVFGDHEDSSWVRRYVLLIKEQ